MLSVIRKLLDPSNEMEILLNAAPFEVIEIVEHSNEYVLRAKGCCIRQIKEFKEYLRKAGFRSLSKKVIVVCT